MENSTRVTVNKRAALVILFFLVGAVLFFVWYANVRAVEPYANCAQIKVATGRSGIPKGDKLYNPAMDRNKNGISCE